MRDYELMYIVRPTVTDEEFPAATERVDALIAGLGGEVTDKQPWGKRRLAYPIDRHEDGYYVVARIRLDPGRTGALEQQLRISEDVIRHVLVEPVAPHVPRQPRERQAPAEGEMARR
ncbi:MAG: 30S ribosomal protein S6 [Chloroflexota bacterium]|nr:30S ribosomal protein S6 [Chloroflexota bacterium]